MFSAWNYCTRGKDLQQKEFWTCTFCATSFKDWNVSKALAHIAKVSGYSIKPCPSNSMTIEETELFTAVVAYKAAVLTKKRSQQGMRDETSEGLIAAATSLVWKKSRGPDPVFGTTSGLVQQSLRHLANGGKLTRSRAIRKWANSRWRRNTQGLSFLTV